MYSRISHCSLILLLSCLGISSTLYALDWDISGSNTLRGTVYNASGSGAGSPYPFKGDMFFDELNLYLDNQDSEYSSWSGEISGLYNVNDDYRSADFGLVPERISLSRENGTGELPFRAQAGDFFAYYSYMTLQRSLKGVQFEIQPRFNDRQQHSIVFTSGANESNWRDLTFQDDYFNGLSWLVQDRKLGSWGMNLTHNYRDNSFKAGTLDRNQYVFSLSAEIPLQLNSHRIFFEAEAAHFNGDHDGISGALSGQERADNGYRVEMRGNHSQLPWDYRFRFEQYGQDFRPRGAVVSADRRSFELHSGWRFNSGIRLRARAQLFEDAFETSNRLRTRTYGVNLTGPFLQNFYPGLNGRLDAYIQNRDNRLITVSQLTHTLTLNLNAPLPSGWTGRLGVFVRNNKNRLGRNGDDLTREVNFGADHRFSLNGWQAYVTPGFTIRSTRKGNNDTEEIRPTLAMRLNRDAHSLNMNYGSRLQDRRASLNGIDVDTHTFNMDYRYTHKQHEVGLEANVMGRDPQPGESTEAWRVSLFWTMEFDRPRAAEQRVAARSISPAGSGAGDTGGLKLDLAQLGPGADATSVLASLSLAGIDKPSKQSGFQVYETTLLENILQRQRLALDFGGGVLIRSALIIDFEDIGDVDSNAQTYERIRQALIRELGNPIRTFDNGDFSPQLINDVNDQRFIRTTEWKTASGTIRFGIPRRLDGQVRMEIQHAPAFGSPRDTLWSIEGVR